MFDIIPHPNFTAKNTAELVLEMNNYLLRLKEILEFEFSSISVDNLSTEFRARLDEIGINIKTINEIKEEEMQQVATRTLTIEDVINSWLFESKLEDIRAAFSDLKDQVDAIAEGKTLEGVDLDNVMYNYSGWITLCKNAPEESGDGVLEVVVAGNGNVMQRFTNIDSAYIFTRWYSTYSKTWSEWAGNL